MNEVTLRDITIHALILWILYYIVTGFCIDYLVSSHDILSHNLCWSFLVALTWYSVKICEFL
jgi:hypothetical protein